MKRRSIAFLLLALLLAVMPAVATANGFKYVKTASGGNVRLRSGPGTDYDIITHVKHGQKVEVYEEKGGWTHVYVNKNEGWISSQYLSSTKPVASNSTNPDVYTDTISTAIFNGFKTVGAYTEVKPTTPGNFVNMRWAPNRATPVIAKYYAGQSLYVVAENSGWYQVYDPQTGDAGFMLKSLTYRY